MFLNILNMFVILLDKKIIKLIIVQRDNKTLVYFILTCEKINADQEKNALYFYLEIHPLPQLIKTQSA